MKIEWSGRIDGTTRKKKRKRTANEKNEKNKNANVLTKNCGKITSITKLHSFRSICFIFRCVFSFFSPFFSVNIFRNFVTLRFTRFCLVKYFLACNATNQFDLLCKFALNNRETKNDNTQIADGFKVINAHNSVIAHLLLWNFILIIMRFESAIHG